MSYQIDCAVSEERRKDLERRVEHARLVNEIRAVQKGSRVILYRIILAKIGSWLTEWGEYLKAHYGEPEQASQVSIRAKTVQG
jgi:hypothetical protein